jgi:2-methylcitrate dehydratase PrpD
MASGVGANYGTMTKPLHCGHAARNSVLATQLAGRGLTASPEAMEGRSGYYDVLARGLNWDLGPFDDLGRTHDLIDRGIWIKRYPCGGLLHSGIDAALTLREQLGNRLAELAGVHVGVTAYAAKRARSRYPETAEAAKFNMQYLVAYALIRGAPGVSAFTDASISDPRVQRLAGAITVAVDPEIAHLIEECPARVTATLADGSQLEVFFQAPLGSYTRPMPRAEIDSKFIACAGAAGNRSRAAELLDILGTFGGTRPLKLLCRLLSGD